MDALFAVTPRAGVDALFAVTPRAGVDALFAVTPRAGVDALFAVTPRAGSYSRTHILGSILYTALCTYVYIRGSAKCSYRYGSQK